MCNTPDCEAMIRALDHALFEQAERWRSFASEWLDTEVDGEQDWMDEFRLLVGNRLEKMRIKTSDLVWGSHRP